MKTIKDQGKKQLGAFKVLEPAEQKLESISGIFPKNLESSKIKNEVNEINKLIKMI